MSLDPLTTDRTTLAGRALDGLRAAIVDGRLAAGERTSVAALAERLGVSRTPVREALLVLERQGLVRFERNRGVRILESSRDDLEEVFALRLLLEVPAARRAAERLTAEELDRLDAELAGMADATAEGPFMAHDQDFHRIVNTAGGNRRLATLVDGLRDHVRLRGASTVGRSRDLDVIRAEHIAIRDALRARDPDAAAAAMRAHLLETARLLGCRPEQVDWPGSSPGV